MPGDVAIIEALPSGTTGPSFLLETASGRLVAKLFRPDSQALLGPAAQHQLLRALEPSGVAARPVASDEEAGVLVTRFLEGAVPLTPEALRAPARISEIASVLRRLHAVDVDLPEFRPADCAGGYLRRIGGYQALTESDRARHRELLELAGTLDRAPLVPCHNDLAAENLLYDGTIHLIDFDYAALAPPIVDLASVASLNDFGPDQIALLIRAYFDGENRCSLTDFARVERLLRLVAHFWSLASADAGAESVARYRITDG